MNAGAWTKIVYETWRTTLLFALALFTFQVVASAVLPMFFDDFAGQLFDHPFMRNIIRALLGTDLGDKFNREAMYAMAWVHPVMLALIWAHEIVFCTRMPVAEVDRGTADVWFALPITRQQHYLCESLACLGTGAILLLASLLGHILGHIPGHIPGSGSDRLPLTILLRLVANLFALYWAVAGLAYLVSTLSNKRGTAIGTVFAIVMLSFFLSFLSQFWPPSEAFSWIGFMQYYRPLEVINDGSWPLFDIGILVGIGTVMWLIGGGVMSRRDLLTT